MQGSANETSWTAFSSSRSACIRAHEATSPACLAMWHWLNVYHPAAHVLRACKQTTGDRHDEVQQALNRKAKQYEMLRKLQGVGRAPLQASIAPTP